MTNFIPIFPLRIVVYPGEKLNLHIFEPRYIQLIKECHIQNKVFGIPVVMKDETAELGCTIEIEQIVKEYEDGKMDVKTSGQNIFRILETIEQVPDKLYSGAIVTYPENVEDGIRNKSRKIEEMLLLFYSVLKIQKNFDKPIHDLTSYELAHFVGLNLEQEYELLGLSRESQRQEYLERHLRNILPVARNLKQLNDRVQQNGHFKNLSF